MTKDEFEALWGMMRGLWTRTENMKIPPKKQIWQMALEPYSAKDVQAAVVSYARKSKFFPDIADITASLQPEIPTEADETPTKGNAIRPGEEWKNNYAVLCEFRGLEDMDNSERFDDYLFRHYPKAWTQRQKAKAEREQRKAENPTLYAKIEQQEREIEEAVRKRLREERGS